MITHYPYDSLGKASFGWLDARYHFSFSTYHNPDRMGFGTLRVINDDIVAPRTGFDTHPHRDMEIITYVRSGAISHRDSEGNAGRTEAGDVQVMSAGTGIQHSEHNREDEATRLYQIWIMPREKGVKPRWDAHQFPKTPTREALSLLVAGDGSAPLLIHQDAYIYAGVLEAGVQIEHPLHQQAYVLISRGEAEIGGIRMRQGDGAEVTDAASLSIQAIADTELLVIDVPAR